MQKIGWKFHSSFSIYINADNYHQFGDLFSQFYLSVVYLYESTIHFNEIIIKSELRFHEV